MKSAPMMWCGPSTSWVSTLPMSCRNEARRTTLTSAPTSAASMAPMWAASTACCSWFWPYDGAELQSADHFDDLGMQAGHARLVGRRLALLADLLLDLLLGLGDDLFDARRMDAAVLDQLGQRQPGDLAAHRIEARQRDRVRRVVDDQVDAGRRLRARGCCGPRGR